jgi:hypothetical protein
MRGFSYPGMAGRILSMAEAGGIRLKQIYALAQKQIQLLLKAKEIADSKHIRECARYGCACRRCKAARLCLTGRKIGA